MNWDKIDNKNYRGPLDDRLVSYTEEYEVKYFIDQWLAKNGYRIDNNSRGVIWGSMQNYPGPRPVVRAALDSWLKTQISPKK